MLFYVVVSSFKVLNEKMCGEKFSQFMSKKNKNHPKLTTSSKPDFRFSSQLERFLSCCFLLTAVAICKFHLNRKFVILKSQ